MSSRVFVRAESFVCECCGKVLALGTGYFSSCSSCGSDICESCAVGDNCRACTSSLSPEMEVK